MALLVAVSAARILDIALTDGTTRTSINAMYQVLPERLRLPAQATIEGTGVPVAISASGLLVLALNTLPSPLTAILVATVAVCAAWVWTGVLLHRSYGPALVDVLRERRLLDGPVALGGTTADLLTAERLLESPDPRSARLGLELVSALAAPVHQPELAFLADDPRAWVRLSALHAQAVSGDAEARAALAHEVRTAEGSDDPDLRARAALALTSLEDADRLPTLGRLLEDPSAAVRTASLDAVHPGDDALVPAVVAALDDPGTTVAACDAVGRLGDAVLTAAEQVLRQASSADPDSAQTLRAVRLARALTTATEARDTLLTRWAGHPDRDVGRVVLERLAAAGPAPAALATVVNHVVVSTSRTPCTCSGRSPPSRPAGTVPTSVGEHRRPTGSTPARGPRGRLTLVRGRGSSAPRAVRHERLEPVTAVLWTAVIRLRGDRGPGGRAGCDRVRRAHAGA